ncbi:hypothetical protein [Pseudaquabacterium pictum]|uniref:Uncharacterized protein n=1 Tax=Pseudaquabacterium pictum TaxID=2315236 RepID=A0A480AW53_9BURK|nr:hypothetical protein [Rubrivivax pictus]GCL64337.1 hypothetical protein AQPW35_34180 [Rubrivivax pictus]
MPDPIIPPGEQPSPRHVEAVTDLAQGLIGAAQSTGHPHGVLLDALLSAYGSLLTRHPCCWAGAAWGLREFASRLDAMQLHQAAAAQTEAERAIAAAARRPA